MTIHCKKNVSSFRFYPPPASGRRRDRIRPLIRRRGDGIRRAFTVARPLRLQGSAAAVILTRSRHSRRIQPANGLRCGLRCRPCILHFTPVFCGGTA
ncbi:hypothetical protein E7W39_03985 [Cronobacter sakazakii]|nr:hypothetical protein AGJ37_22515 [Cronobacter sakazakii]KAB1001311.1 hypothetical protein FZI48_21815 [Cronobacter sakazakii]MCI0278057.1 hypothetical protein [Cronobacter sakazakii]NCI06388.1 hypothetical protein [Cronobacter sakazakii]HAU5453931.1 hypothetical protein [Cronobacter sakazakii]